MNIIFYRTLNTIGLYSLSGVLLSVMLNALVQLA